MNHLTRFLDPIDLTNIYIHHYASNSTKAIPKSAELLSFHRGIIDAVRFSINNMKLGNSFYMQLIIERSELIISVSLWEISLAFMQIAGIRLNIQSELASDFQI